MFQRSNESRRRFRRVSHVGPRGTDPPSGDATYHKVTADWDTMTEEELHSRLHHLQTSRPPPPSSAPTYYTSSGHAALDGLLRRAFSRPPARRSVPTLPSPPLTGGYPSFQIIELMGTAETPVDYLLQSALRSFSRQMHYYHQHPPSEEEPYKETKDWAAYVCLTAPPSFPPGVEEKEKMEERKRRLLQHTLQTSGWGPLLSATHPAEALSNHVHFALLQEPNNLLDIVEQLTEEVQQRKKREKVGPTNLLFMVDSLSDLFLHPSFLESGNYYSSYHHAHHSSTTTTTQNSYRHLSLNVFSAELHRQLRNLIAAVQFNTHSTVDEKKNTTNHHNERDCIKVILRNQCLPRSVPFSSAAAAPRPFLPLGSPSWWSAVEVRLWVEYREELLFNALLQDRQKEKEKDGRRKEEEDDDDDDDDDEGETGASTDEDKRRHSNRLKRPRGDDVKPSVENSNTLGLRITLVKGNKAGICCEL